MHGFNVNLVYFAFAINQNRIKRRKKLKILKNLKEFIEIADIVTKFHILFPSSHFVLYFLICKHSAQNKMKSDTCHSVLNQNYQVPKNWIFYCTDKTFFSPMQ